MKLKAKINHILLLGVIATMLSCTSSPKRYMGNQDTDVSQVTDDTVKQRVDTLTSSQASLCKTVGKATKQEEGNREQRRHQMADLRKRTVSKYFADRDSDSLRVGRAQLTVPKGAMAHARVLSITPLRKGELPLLPAGMVNVTGSCDTLMARTDTVAGYRFLPHGNHFVHHLASITVPYDSTLIPQGYTADDIHTYYYDEMRHQWTMLPSRGVDVRKEVAMAETSHFTDVINGIIKVPESPETQNYVPTSISDLKAADPGAGIQQIEAPTANQNGTASLSYPFQTPSGRNDIAASAGLQYSSDGGSSYTGYGWSLPVQSIDIETRWGVPRFDGVNESESYLLMGQQLNDRLYRTTDSLKRQTDKQFWPMVEGGFNKIVRRGDSPANYYWEVTAKDGTIYSYGGYNGKVSDASTLTDDKGNRIKWALERITDVHGNFAAFHYVKHGNNLYPGRYTWTGYGNEEGLYSIEFVLDSVSGTRKDATRNGRLGILQTDDVLLTKVIVSNNGQQMRAYQPHYEVGPFGKTLLKSMDQLDSKDQFIASQSFEYYNDVEKGMFGEAQRITSVKDKFDQSESLFKHHINNCDDKLSILGGGYSSGKTVGGGMMVGFGIGIGTMNVGASYSYSKNEGVGKISMVDIDGDGLPDKVFTTSSGLRYRKNLVGQGKWEFGESKPITGINEFSRSTSTSNCLSTDAGVEVTVASVGISYTHTTDQDKTKVYFSDFNSDGLVDIAKNGTVYFNHSDGEHVYFSPSSRGTGNAIISLKKADIDSTFVPNYAVIRDSLERQFPLHDVVRMWRAPYGGKVNITSVIEKTNSLGDGVIYAIQHGNTVLKRDSLLSKRKNTDVFKERTVKAGDQIYFRLQSRYSGSHDEVNWHPVINYVKKAGLSDSIRNYIGMDVLHYDVANDFMPGENSVALFDKSGTVTLTAPFTKEKTNDDITLLITKKTVKDSVLLKKIVLPADSVVKDSYDTQFDVLASDSVTLSFNIETGAPIDWKKVSWKPKYKFIYKSDGNDVEDSLKINPYQMMYNKPLQVSASYIKGKLIARADSSYQPYVMAYPALEVWRQNPAKDFKDAVVHMNINDENGQLLYKKDFTLTQLNKLKAEPIRFENEFAKKLVEGKARVTYSISNELSTVKVGYLKLKKDSIVWKYDTSKKEMIFVRNISVKADSVKAFVFSGFNKNDFGMLYRGWGQFAYNGNKEYAKDAIDENELKIDESGYEDVANKYDKSKDEKDLVGALDEVNKQRFFSLGYNMDRGEYVSSTDSAYISATTQCSSRLGVTEIVVDSVNYADADDALSAPVLMTEAKSNGFGVSGGVSFASATGSWSKQESYTTVAAMDMNGDGYPDWIEDRDKGIRIQYTADKGTLSSKKYHENVPCPKTTGESVTVGCNVGIPVVSKEKKDGDPKGAIAISICPKEKKPKPNSNAPQDNASQASDGNKVSVVSVSASGNFSGGSSRADREWMDINGDGLPDMVMNDQVLYNLGYGFSSAVNRGLTAMTSSTNDNWGAGLGTKINVLGPADISFGVNGTVTTSNNTVTYIDINGDGLPDALYKDDSDYGVAINTGAGYVMNQLGSMNLGENKSSSISVYGDFAVKLSIHVLFLKFCLTPSVKGGVSQGVNRTTAAIMDVDGDGLPDLVESDGTDALIVCRNLTGRTNKLKSVVLPFGGHINIGYELTQPSFDHPGRQWVMSSVETTGGYKENGAVASKNTFEYEGGYRDRKERDFYGYRSVRTNQLNTQDGDKLYRYSVQTYGNNRDYYAHNLVTSEALFDADNHKLQGSFYTYKFKAQKDSNVVFPQLVALVQSNYDEQSGDSLATRVENSYDAFGNLIAYKETAAGFELDADISYHNKDAKYIVSVPKDIVVKSNNITYRHRSTKVDDNGEITQITMHNGDKPSVYDMSYDEYGNILRMQKPANYKNERMEYAYTYDNDYHTMVTRVVDAFGYSSSTEYDKLWNAPLVTTDLNGEKMEYTYDDAGRPATIRAPYEIASKQPFTIRYEYDPANRRAHTIHYAQDGNIDTYTFADSLMRAVQTKQLGSVWNGTRSEKVSIVSGRTVVDAFGRNVAAYYPMTESFAAIGTYNSKTGDPVSSTQYDTHDRTVEVKLSDGATTTSRYAVVNHGGEAMLETRVTDALGRSAESYTDEKGRNRETVQHSESGDVRVSYDYDPVGQVLTVHHPNDRTTTYEYDLLGQKLRVNHPDAGEVVCTYDAAGNLLTKLTAQLRESISDKAPIAYTYDYNRLKEVLYPENLFNRVTYTYGEPGDKYGRAGRLALVEDASGGEAYYYGRMGEVTKTVRTVMASLSDIRTYVYGASYDSWNRVRTMTYPDGEVVTYHYNEAGQVSAVSSNKLGKESVIVDEIGYDKEGHTVYTKLGNGTETRYTYDRQRERLQQMTLMANGDSIMNNQYSYDAVDNILSIANTAGGSGKLGGKSSHEYQYDMLNRLVSAKGSAKDATYDMAMTFGRMSEPLTKVQKVDKSSTAKSYALAYKYEDEKHPTAPSEIGHEHYTYDANGNPVRVENDSTNETREMFWDEDNRLMVLSDNGKTSRYTYNAAGERIVKSHGNMEGVYINGAPQGITFHEVDDYTMYPASILTVSKHRFTKHYFIGDKRIASRIGVGQFNNVYGRNGSNVTAGQQDYAERMNQIEHQKEAYYQKLGIAPGVPTMKGAYGDPENTGVGYNDILTPLGDHSVPANWVQHPVRNEAEGSAPGSPISWASPENPDNAPAGYGYTANDTSSVEETFFYHSDHLGSTSYITDANANVTQFDAYLPYGELLVDEHSSSEDLPYKFNGKEFDEETGLYYYGARYMNPVTSMWYGVDPLAEKYAASDAYVYCLGNPVKLVDPDGNKVIVFSSKLPVDKTNMFGSFVHDYITVATHTFVAVFNEKNELMQYYSFGPVEGDWLGGELEMNAYPSISKDKVAQIYSSDKQIISNYQKGNLKNDDFYKSHKEINVPQGMSQKEFDKKVIDAGKRYGSSSGMRYQLNPQSKTTGNCNKGSYNLLKQAGVDDKTLKNVGKEIPGITWGWGEDMPWTKKEQEKAQLLINRLSEKNSLRAL